MNMVKNASLIAIGLVCLCGIACEKANEMAKKTEHNAMGAAHQGAEMAKKGAEAAEKLTEEAVAKAKEEYAKLTSGHFAAIEQKMKDLAGEKATEAETLFEKVKEKVTSLKDAAPEKFAEMKAEAEKLINELKEKVGL